MDDAEIKELIKRINARCADGSYIFRGTREIHKDTKTEYGISSTLYRKYEEPKRKWTSKYRPANIEKGIIKRLKNRQKDYRGYTNIEILTDLRHYGGNVTLIDFSLNLYTALFFACNGEFNTDGQLIMLERSGIRHIDDIDYSADDYKDTDLSIINPAPTKDAYKRALSQNSIFVHAPDGFIPRDADIIKIEEIDKDDKKGILAYLEKNHKISQNSIYNDLLGFIDSEKNYASSRDKFDEGSLHDRNGDFSGAIELYDEAINLDPSFAESYLNRAFAKINKGDNKGAKKDLADLNRLNQDTLSRITRLMGVAEDEIKVDEYAKEQNREKVAEEEMIEWHIEEQKREAAEERRNEEYIEKMVDEQAAEERRNEEYIEKMIEEQAAVKAAEEKRKAEQADDSTESINDEEDE